MLNHYDLRCLFQLLTIVAGAIALLSLPLGCSQDSSESKDTPGAPLLSQETEEQAVIQSAPADLVLRGGKIATVDDAFSMAQAVAVRGDKFVFVGADNDVEPYIGPETKVIELEGKLVVPGLIDAHVHMMTYGMGLDALDFRGINNFPQIAEMVAEKAQQLKPGQWILGANWDQNDWEIKKLPTHHDLTQAAPDNPVWLIRVDVHAALANQKAMEFAGVTAQTVSPEGGEIHVDENGQPTGVFIDNAMALIEDKVPRPTTEQARAALANAAQQCLSVGLTGVHDAGVTPLDVENYKYLIDNDQLPIRVNAMLYDPGLDDLNDFMKQNLITEYGNNFLTVKCMKMLMDGALGSRGAYMFEPYSDRPESTGLLTVSYERCLAVSRFALQNGYQMSIHAIGDRANHEVLNAFEAALTEFPNPDHRFRVEHSQIMAPDDILRYKPLGVLPSMQPTHATSDMYWAADRVGSERAKGAYAWRKFLDTGVIIPCGSDFPVEKTNPLLGFYAAITRQDPSGYPDGGWFPDQRMTRQEALKGFTIWAAYAAFQEDILGSIEVDKLADMTVLSKDILTIEPKEILTTACEYTITAGKIRYTK